MNVKVYYNLHKKCLSVVANEGEKKGKVIYYADTIHLEDVTFKVSEAGRQRVLTEMRKNVHAFIYGNTIYQVVNPVWNQITYNPYKYSSFVDKNSLEPVHTAKHAIVHGRSILASN